MPIPDPSSRNRRAVYSVTETAKLCELSRARFYDLVHQGVLPWPVYDLRTKRPLYTADLAAICVRVRQTNVGIDGRYVIFYCRRQPEAGATRSSRSNAVQRPTQPDPLVAEMIETLRAMGVQESNTDILSAIANKCPNGVAEASFETDLRAVFDRLRCRKSA